MRADTLMKSELEGTLRAACRLRGVDWAKPLLNHKRTKQILDRLRGWPARPHKLTADKLPLLFEIRFAAALAAAGLSAEYEYNAGVGDSTIDFRVATDPPWLVELVSLRESEAFKKASWNDGVCQGYILDTHAEDPKQSLEGEAVRAQEKIGAKIFDGKKPIKFPEPSGCIHMVMVDARGFGGDGHGDVGDWRQIVHGPAGLERPEVLCWTNPKTGNRKPISGLFEPECPLGAAKTSRDRVHVIGFVCEKIFAEREISEQAFYLCNPHLLGDAKAAQATMSGWPLRRAAAPGWPEDG